MTNDTATRPPLPRPKAPPPPLPPAGRAAREPGSFTVESGATVRPQRIVIYGTRGIGKSSLAAMAPAPVFIDVEQGTNEMDVRRVAGVQAWADIRAALHEPSLWKDAGTVVVDSGTAAQELAIAHTIQTVKHEKGYPIQSIEDYGFGKGYQHVYDTFIELLGDLDAHVRAGRNVVLVLHESVEKAPNPSGEDFLRYEPHLLQPPRAGRIRDRVANWCDHLLYVGYDREVKAGKAKGSGSRTVYCREEATFWAKSRRLRDPIVFDEGSTALWDALFARGGDS